MVEAMSNTTSSMGSLPTSYVVAGYASGDWAGDRRMQVCRPVPSIPSAGDEFATKMSPTALRDAKDLVSLTGPRLKKDLQSSEMPEI
jgi:hypothetical protein